jgi:hypothetical protein
MDNGRSWTSYYYFMFVPTTNQFVTSFWSCRLPKELSNVCNMVGLYYWTTRMVDILHCAESAPSLFPKVKVALK